MLESLRKHWPEYLIEAWGLGTFMVSACMFGVLLFHPDSFFSEYSISFRNILMGIAMGATAIAIFCSPWGKRSGAHINPAVTFTFYRLGKIDGSDAIFYVAAQFLGGVLGVVFAWLILGERLAVSHVNFVATVPGGFGVAAAFAGEMVIAFFMMTMVLVTSNHGKFYKFTPFIAGLMVAFYIAVEAPISGMSMNPARTFGSAFVGDVWTAWWIYFAAPPIAMLAAAEVYVRKRGIKAVLCAKFHHNNTARCIFNCRFDELEKVSATEGTEILPNWNKAGD
ncbi:MAG: MIP/aquaporin family protein [Blastocatellia bacterium]